MTSEVSMQQSFIHAQLPDESETSSTYDFRSGDPRHLLSHGAEQARTSRRYVQLALNNRQRSRTEGIHNGRVLSHVIDLSTTLPATFRASRARGVRVR